MLKNFLLFLFSITVYTLQAQSPLCSSYPNNFGYEYVSSITINGQTYQGAQNFTSKMIVTGKQK